MQIEMLIKIKTFFFKKNITKIVICKIYNCFHSLSSLEGIIWPVCLCVREHSPPADGDMVREASKINDTGSKNEPK